MEKTTENTMEEILGLEEFLERYTNPVNRIMYETLISIFIDKEETNILNSINDMISNEESLHGGDITSVFYALMIRSCNAVLKNAYGIIIDETKELRLADLYDVILKLKFLTNPDNDRADYFITIIDNRNEDFDAYAMILEELGVEIGFIHENIDSIDYDFLDEYSNILKRMIESSKNNEEGLGVVLGVNNIIDSLLAIGKAHMLSSNILDIAVVRQNFITDKDILTIVNGNSVNDSTLAFELLAGYKLSQSTVSLADFYKNYTENYKYASGDIDAAEIIFVDFKNMEAEYKIELARRID